MKRSEVAVQDTWDLTTMFASNEVWEGDYKAVSQEIENFASWKKSMGESSTTFLKTIQNYMQIERHMSKLAVYAMQRADEDAANSFYQTMKQKVDRMYVRFDEVCAWMEPKIMELGREWVDNAISEEPALKEYSRFLHDILRMEAHIASPEIEELLASAGEIALAPDNIYSMFSYADLKFPAAVDSQGNTHSVTAGSFAMLEESQDRTLRKSVYESLYGTYEKFQNTVAAMFAANVQQAGFYAKARKYPSTRAYYLDDNKIPEEVYDNLIDTIHKNIHLLHRYVRLRKKMLGVEELHFYDVYTPLVKDFTHVYSFEEAEELVKEGLRPLGEEYLSLLQEGFDHRWIDKYENEGKRSGAYSGGCYDSVPYVLMNFTGNLDNVFTLAHEMGHSLHSYYSRHNQPYQDSHYRIFVAEVASTCNEALLNEYLLSKATDKTEKMYLLNHFLESYKGTVFRQTMFAEFEYLCHKKVQEGKILTAGTLNQYYKELNEFYFGSDMICDDKIALEWARIPHFYTPFYVYQYATGFSAAMALSNKILQEGQPAVENYKKFLKLGCSVDSISALKVAGVDMSSSKPIEEALIIFENMLAQMEALLEE